MSDDMINLRAALACEYAANALRAAHTFESAAHIYGIDAAPSITSRSGDGVDNLRQAAELLGFKLSPINHGETPATEPQVNHILLTAGGVPQKDPPAPQDVFLAEADYSHGLSGRLG